MNNIKLINNPNYIPSPVGKFFIKYNPSLEKCGLGMGDEVFGYYVNTIQAADDVYCQSTGCYEWDNYNINKISAVVPIDI